MRSRGFVVVACLLVLCGTFVLAALETSVTVDAPANGSVAGGNISINLTLPDDSVNLTLTVTNGTDTWLLNESNLTSGAFNVTWQTTNGSFRDGLYNLSLYACNATNASDNLTISIGNITVDNTPPAVGPVSTNATRNATRANATITITVNVTDRTALAVNISNATVRPMAFLSGNLYRYTGNATDLGCPANGTCVLTVNATDALGQGNRSITFNLTIDDITPNITAIGESGIDSNEGTISATADEAVLFTLRYGTESATLSSTDVTSTYAGSYAITLEGLDAGTTYYYNLTACDAAGNCLTNGTRSFTTSALSGGGGGGGGGGGYVPAATTVEAKYGRVWGSVPQGPFSYTPIGVAFNDVGFTLNGSINRLKIEIIQHKERPTSIVPLTGPLIYRYVEIVHEGIQGASGYHVSFRIPNDWLASNGVGTDLIKLYRLESGGVWTAYEATPTDVVDGSQEFTVALPGFSAFAIAANPSAPEPVIASTPTETAAAQEEAATAQQPPVEDAPVSPSAESPAPIIATTGEKGGGIPRMILVILGVIGVLAAASVVVVHQRRVTHERVAVHERELAQERERLAQERAQKRETFDAHDSAAKEAAAVYAAPPRSRPVTAPPPAVAPAAAASPIAFASAAPVDSTSRNAEQPLARHPAYHTHIAPLREYVRKARDRGLSDAHVAQRLLEAGWNAQIVEHELGTAPKGRS